MNTPATVPTGDLSFVPGLRDKWSRLGACEGNGGSYFHVRCYADTVEEYALLSAVLHMFVGFKRTSKQKLSSVVMSGQLRSTIIGYRCVHKQRRAKAHALTTVFSDESGVQVTGDTGLGVERFRCPEVLFHRSAAPDPPEGHIITEIDTFASSTDNLNIIALDHLKMNVAFVGNNEHFDNEIRCHCMPELLACLDRLASAMRLSGRRCAVPAVRG